MKQLLIHSNNTSFSQVGLFTLSEQFVFDIDFDKDVDYYIDENLAGGDLKRKVDEADIIFIKVSLSQNYLEYLGIRLAYHIRLTKSLGLKAMCPIVFIAEETFQFLGLTSMEPSILFTGGIYLIREDIEDYNKVVKCFSNGQIRRLEDFSSFVGAIKISPPANYQSHHSIANEWALTRYFSMLEKNDRNEEYRLLRNKVAELNYLRTLHFKYSEALASRQTFNPKKHGYTPKIHSIESKRIGVIDDELNKGWLSFYDYLFKRSNAQSFPFTDFRKDEGRYKLIENIKTWVSDNFKTEDPVDIFIIDLRLHDDDFLDTNFDNLSGFQIIQFIKARNPGVQIVISTASNKVWNFEKCLEFGISFFAVKESPESFSNREETKQSLIHLCKQISRAADRSFLAELFRRIEDLKNENYFFKDNIEVEFRDLVFGKNGLLDQVFSLLILDHNKDAVLNQCLLIAFQILENYCDLNCVGIFDFKNSSGKVCQINTGNLLDIFTLSTDHMQLLTKLELVRGKFSFQDTSSSETIKSFVVSDQSKLTSAYSNIVDTTSMVKIISVLHFRHTIAKNDIEKIIALRYYRSNVAAHLTGKVTPEYRITAIDLIFVVDLFSTIFKK